MCSAVTFLVSKSTSQNTGVAPLFTIAFTLATQVKLGTMTSPEISWAFIAISKADAHEFILNAYFEPINSLKESSNKLLYFPGASHPDSNTSITVDKQIRNGLVENLNIMNIGASVHFDPPVHTQEYYRDFEVRVSLENTELLANSIVTLPMYANISEEEITYVVDSIQKSLEKSV